MKFSNLLVVASVFLSAASYAQTGSLYFFDGYATEMVPKVPTAASALNKVIPEENKCFATGEFDSTLCISGRKQQITSVFDEKTLVQTITTKERSYTRKVTNPRTAWSVGEKYSDKIWGELKVSKKSVTLKKYIAIPSVKRKLVCTGELILFGRFECNYEDGGISAGPGQKKIKINHSKIVTLTDARFPNQNRIDVVINLGATQEQVIALRKEMEEQNPGCQISVPKLEEKVSLIYNTLSKEHSLWVMGHYKKVVQPKQTVDAYIEGGRDGDVSCHFEL